MNPLTKPRVPSLMELCEKEQIFAPCVWDCRTIHAAEVAGFKAVLLSGGQVAESMCGVPDIGLITADDRAGLPVQQVAGHSGRRRRLW